MANPSSADRSFIEQRRAGRYVGLYVLPTILVGVLACWIGLFAWWPLAVNPWFAVGAFEGQVVEPGMVTKYAMSTAVLVNLLMLAISSAAHARHRLGAQRAPLLAAAGGRHGPAQERRAPAREGARSRATARR